jgi:hypothetical protein
MLFIYWRFFLSNLGEPFLLHSFRLSMYYYSKIIF